MIDILESTVAKDFKALVLTNAMKPMQRRKEQLLALNKKYPGKLLFRISLDHYSQELHEQERGPRSWQPAIEGLVWLYQNGFSLEIASRSCWQEGGEEMRKGQEHPEVAACTLTPYDSAFSYGRTLQESWQPIKLNHRFCSKFCVLGGGSCS